MFSDVKIQPTLLLFPTHVLSYPSVCKPNDLYGQVQVAPKEKETVKHWCMGTLAGGTRGRAEIGTNSGIYSIVKVAFQPVMKDRLLNKCPGMTGETDIQGVRVKSDSYLTP